MAGLLFKVRLCCLIQAFLWIPGSAYSSESSLRLELPDGQELEVTRFPGAGSSLLLWLPSERGLMPAHKMHPRRWLIWGTKSGLPICTISTL